MNKGKLIIFSAPSGSGKTTIVRHLLTKELPLEFSVSATSRTPRHTETDGKDYYFLSPDEFKQRIDTGDFLEWEEVYTDTFYGTLIEEVERIRDKGHHVLFDVDVVGGVNIKKYYGEDALSIFVKPPSVEALEERLKGRSTDSDEVIQKRLAKANYELSFEPKFDYVLVNDQIEVAFGEAETVVHNFVNNID
ncbi:guanylate kinase [Halosquirtibacter xylanolyticus]|uniref:guanylate kinase n=1 Tax=Halosquirtibacter xylanolyticus TaxID=3374599 RepID=UPI003747FB97|nr:guanylate kinase [Prolixibacteraceae bacterium]